VSTKIIYPVIVGDKVYFCTSAGLAHEAKAAWDYASKNVHDTTRTEPWYLDFSYDMLKSNLSPSFEWNSEDQLILTTIKSHMTGDYLPRETMLALAAPYYIPTEMT
jgi:hypothetical protein